MAFWGRRAVAFLASCKGERDTSSVYGDKFLFSIFPPSEPDIRWRGGGIGNITLLDMMGFPTLVPDQG